MTADSIGLTRTHADGVYFHTDPDLRARSGIAVVFTERSGGVSTGEYASLNLAGHVGDDPAAVDENRARVLHAIRCDTYRDRLVTAEQVHGEHIVRVTGEHAGRGARVADGPPPLDATDAMFTTVDGIPLLTLYADCVPVVLVSEAPRAVAVVHAGWRGALASLPGKTVTAFAGAVGCDIAKIAAYIGPHIASCCYNVDETLISHFSNKFDTIAAVDGRLDLGAYVLESLAAAGVGPERVARMGECTFDHADRYFSYRASGITGRHGALAVITKVG